MTTYCSDPADPCREPIHKGTLKTMNLRWRSSRHSPSQKLDHFPCLHSKSRKSAFRVLSISLLFPCHHLVAATLFVSQIGSSPTPPYGSWGTAATDIQQAMDASAAGDLILVSNGVYAGPLIIDRPVMVMSY